jgi:hypothetical protein
MDAKSLTVAMSINLGINSLSELFETPDVLTTMTFNSTDSYTNETISVYMSSYYQVRYLDSRSLFPHNSLSPTSSLLLTPQTSHSRSTSA